MTGVKVFYGSYHGKPGYPYNQGQSKQPGKTAGNCLASRRKLLHKRFYVDVLLLAGSVCYRQKYQENHQ